MELFEVLRDDPNLGTGRLDAAHKWALPGVICPHCKATWGSAGLEYPAVDLSSLPGEKAYREPGAVPLNEFARLRSDVARLMEPDARLLPGTQFGPLVGKGTGRFPADFAWLTLWTLLITKEGFAWLTDRIPNLNGVSPQLKFADEQPMLLELYLEPLGELVLVPADDDEDPCDVCGRNPTPLPDEIVVVKSSIPTNRHIFRARNFNTVLLATDRFVKAVQDLGLVGLVFNPVKLLTDGSDSTFLQH
jgi:uncharacterized double-CXXCG motif protein